MIGDSLLNLLSIKFENSYDVIRLSSGS